MPTRRTRLQAAILHGDSILLLDVTLDDGRRFWMLPGGGLEPDDATDEAAIRREVREETSLEVTVGRALADSPAHADDTTYRRYRTYLCRVRGGEIRNDIRDGIAQILDIRWLPLNDEADWGPAVLADVYLYPQLVAIRAAVANMGADQGWLAESNSDRALDMSMVLNARSEDSQPPLYHIRDEEARVAALARCALPPLQRDGLAATALGPYPATVWLPALESAEHMDVPDERWRGWEWPSGDSLLVHADRDPCLPGVYMLTAPDSAACHVTLSGRPMRVRQVAPGDQAGRGGAKTTPLRSWDFSMMRRASGLWCRHAQPSAATHFSQRCARSR